VAELDSRSFHGTVTAFEQDRERDRALNVAGWRVIRVTWQQLAEGRQALIADLRALLPTAPALRFAA
jgi:very-short-patch-repair endonuclease